MTINPYESPNNHGQSPVRKIGRLKMRLIELLAVIGVIGMLFALFLPARRSVSEASRRSYCNNNLKLIGLALLSYEETYHALPPAYTVDVEGRPLHSWRTLILPFMGEMPLYKTIDLSKPWNDPANKTAFENGVLSYRCPSTVCPPTHTTYLAIVGPGGCFRPTEPRMLAEISDPHESTLMVMEVAPNHAVHWMSPADTTESEVVNLAPATELAHPGARQALTVAGSVFVIGADLKPDQLRAMISIAGNDDAIAGAD